jgi:ApeA N-terminal domain 1
VRVRYGYEWRAIDDLGSVKQRRDDAHSLGRTPTNRKDGFFLSVCRSTRTTRMRICTNQFCYSWAELWLSKRIVHFDPEEYALSGGDTANYKVKQPDQDVIRLESIFSTVSLGTIVQMPGMPFVDLKVTAESYSRFTPDVPKELDWHIKRSMALCAFLTLSAACPMYPSRIQAKIHQDSEPIHILVGLQRRQTCKFEHLHEFFLVRGALGIELADAIKKWFSVYEKFETACGLTVSVLNSEGLWLHVEFLSLMQALEGYHRSAFDGLYMKDADYEPVKTALSTAIPIDVSADHRSALKARIRYGNQWALRKRLADLTTKLEEQTKKLLLGVVGAIPDRWVDTRNYYTHWDESLRGAVLDNAEMLYACVRMKNLLRVLYLREAGIPFEQINQALKHTSDAAQQLIFANARNRGLGH